MNIDYLIDKVLEGVSPKNVLVQNSVPDSDDVNPDLVPLYNELRKILRQEVKETYIKSLYVWNVNYDSDEFYIVIELEYKGNHVGHITLGYSGSKDQWYFDEFDIKYRDKQIERMYSYAKNHILTYLNKNYIDLDISKFYKLVKH